MKLIVAGLLMILGISALKGQTCLKAEPSFLYNSYLSNIAPGINLGVGRELSDKAMVGLGAGVISYSVKQNFGVEHGVLFPVYLEAAALYNHKRLAPYTDFKAGALFRPDDHTFILFCEPSLGITFNRNNPISLYVGCKFIPSANNIYGYPIKDIYNKNHFLLNIGFAISFESNESK